MTNKTIYLKGLNGIRAIAALAVVISHITLGLDKFGLDPYVFGAFEDGKPRTLDLASYGVSMFFVLSGFLITYLLCKEKEKESIDIKKFYLRRILRIWPLYYVYLFFCLVVIFLFGLDYHGASIYYYVFYAANIPFIMGTALPFLSHYWSLGVEEQFYMFWPWLNKIEHKKLIIVSVFLTILLIGTKISLHLFIPNTILEVAIGVTRFHCMLIGAIAALLFYEKNNMFLKITTFKPLQLFAWGILFLVAINQYHLASFIDNEIITIISAIIIIGQVTDKGVISLENALFDYLGKISYGIYVIHPLLIFLFSKVWVNISSYSLLNYFIVYTGVVLGTVLIAHLSYNYLEKPFLLLKTRKFSVVKSSASKNYLE
ncbi:MAG: acyltransferase family protein [Chitinophagales bacterium]